MIMTYRTVPFSSRSFLTRDDDRGRTPIDRKLEEQLRTNLVCVLSGVVRHRTVRCPSAAFLGGQLRTASTMMIATSAIDWRAT
jgi:hypothetical protein